MTTRRFMTVAAIAAVTATVLGGANAAVAFSNDAVKRAIVTIVLKNLGVEPSPSIVNALVAELPIDALSSTLVEEVGSALDAGDDPSLIIGQTVDSDGDGIPNENAAMEAETDDDTETDDDSDSSDNSDDSDSSDDSDDSSGGGSGSSGSGSGGSDDDSNDDSEDDNSGDTEDGEDDGSGDSEDDDEGPDN